jgi:Dolichyl-phosphate-mannose-protein mannosyltransferase
MSADKPLSAPLRSERGPRLSMADGHLKFGGRDIDLHRWQTIPQVVTARIVAAALIAIACAFAISTYPTFGHTWDEPEHIAAGMQLVDRGIYTYDVQHPPLGRVAMAIGPYLAGARSFGEPGPSGEQEGRDLLYRTGHYERILTLARLGTIPFFLALFAAVWFWTRRWFEPTTAAIAVFFVAATPPLIGHAALAALDIPGAGTLLLAMYFILRFIEEPRRWSAVLAGVTSGLAIATKLSAVPFLLLVVPLWLIAARFSEPTLRFTRRFWALCALFIGTALLTTMLTYGFKTERLTDATHRPNAALDYIFGERGTLHDISYDIAAHVPLPVGASGLALSVKALQEHNNEGHRSYFMGELRDGGWWDFYLVALAVKTPLPLLLLGLGGLIYMSSRGVRERRSVLAAPAIAFVTILIFCSAYSHINIGVRHVIVLFPLLAIGAAVAVMELWSHWRHRAVHVAVAALLFCQAYSIWRAEPDYLAYFNTLAGEHPEHLLIDSDLDWGQDMRRLEHRLRKLNVKEFHLVYRGTADLIREDLPPFTLLKPDVRVHGWIAAGLLAKATLNGGKGYEWLNDYVPVERVGKSIDLYYIP